jgi:hypothetical protein
MSCPEDRSEASLELRFRPRILTHGPVATIALAVFAVLKTADIWYGM